LEQCAHTVSHRQVVLYFLITNKISQPVAHDTVCDV